MAVSSYGAATKTSGVVRILKDLDHDLEGPRRAARRGHRGLRPHAEVPAEEPRGPQARVARGGGAPAQGGHPEGAARPALRGLRHPATSSSSATGSTSPSATGTCRTSRRCKPGGLRRRVTDRRRREPAASSSPSKRHATDPFRPSCSPSALAVVLRRGHRGAPSRRGLRDPWGGTAGPQCPVVRRGRPCPDAPWSGTIDITAGRPRRPRSSTVRRRALRDRARARAPIGCSAVSEGASDRPADDGRGARAGLRRGRASPSIPASAEPGRGSGPGASIVDWAGRASRRGSMHLHDRPEEPTLSQEPNEPPLKRLTRTPTLWIVLGTLVFLLRDLVHRPVRPRATRSPSRSSRRRWPRARSRPRRSCEGEQAVTGRARRRHRSTARSTRPSTRTNSSPSSTRPASRSRSTPRSPTRSCRR